MSNNRYYVYELIDPRSNLPFYVGKGTNRRVTDHFKSFSLKKNTPKNQKINKILSLGLEPQYNIIKDHLTEEDAYNLEITLIEKYKRIKDGGILTNLAPGGEGVGKGFVPWHKGKKGIFSEEQRKKWSNERSGEKNPFYGRKHSEQAKEKTRQTFIKNDSFKDRKPNNMKPVMCIETGEVFESATAAARAKGVDHANLSGAASGKFKTCGKLHWTYI